MTADILKFPPPFEVHRSIARIVTIDGRQWQVYCEDWPTPNACENAQDAVLEFSRSTSNGAPNWDSLADAIMLKLRIPADTVFGCSVIGEEIPHPLP